MIKGRTKTAVKVLLALVGLIFCFLLVEHVRGKVSLANYKRALIAKGEKLTFKELIPPVPQAENGAPEVMLAVEQLRKGLVMPHNYPPLMPLAPSGRAIVAFREPEWVDRGTYRDGEWKDEKVTNRWDQLALDLKTNAAALAQLRAALQKPVLNNELDYTDPATMPIDHLVAAKKAGQWLCAAVQLALHEGRLTDAAENLVALVRLARLRAEDRLVISELVRFGIGAVARAATWQALQADGLSDADLARIQQAWNEEDFLSTVARSLEGERAYGQATFDLLRRSNAEAVALSWSFLPPQLASEELHEARRQPWPRLTRGALVLYSFIWRSAWLDQNQQRYLERMQQLIEAARNAATNNSRAQTQLSLAQLNAQTTNKTFYDKLRFPEPELITTIAPTLKHAFRA